MLPFRGGIFETLSVIHSKLPTIQLEQCDVIDTRALCAIVLATIAYERVKQFRAVQRCQGSQPNESNGYLTATAAATQQSV